MAGRLQLGATIDGFRLDELLHAGGMATLYRVSGPGGDGPLVMKIPRLGQGEPASNLVSFEAEQLILEALHGPHVPRFVARGDFAREPYLVMEQIVGTSLLERAERAPLPSAEVARVGASVAVALHSLHRQDAIHLDVKPANVLLRPEGVAVFVDFGLAHHGHLPDLLAEEYRHPIGSAPYISPEQVAGVRSDPRSDLFALGAVLYELATGRQPFGHPTTARGLRTRLWRPPIPPRAIVPSVPAWLQEVILRCLEVDGGERYPSAAQVAFDLANPEQVAVGDAGHRVAGPGPAALLRRWIRAAAYEPADVPRSSTAVARAAIVVAALGPHGAEDAHEEAMREAVRRVLATAAGRARLAVVTVIDPTPILGTGDEETAARRRLRHAVLLRRWAEPLRLPVGGVSFHVLESADPAAALLGYARANRVDHVVVGAPPRDARLGGMLGGVPAVGPQEPLHAVRMQGTLSVRLAAEAPCSVTLVRTGAID